jgi:hypothetical protein
VSVDVTFYHNSLDILLIFVIWCQDPQTKSKPYLIGTVAHDVGELLDNQVNTFQRRLLEAFDLGFHGFLERSIRREEANADS